MTRLVIEHAAIATVDDPDWRAGAGTEHADGHVVVEDGVITAVGSGPSGVPGDRVVDAGGALVTPGLVNTHHHLYQWSTRGYAQESTLFEWLVRLYPVWAGLDADIEHAAATAGLAALARSGCTTAADHHYVHPRDGGDTSAALVAAAARVGVRLHLVRGSMDRGESHGGLPPDSLVEGTEGALTATERDIARFHDPEPGARVQVAVAPCSPFSASVELMREAAALARRHGVRLHTHLAETLDEEEHCVAQFGRTPIDYADELGWLGDDVWLAHGIHFDDRAVARLGATRTGVAHCPSSNARLGAGIARVRDLLDAGSPVGLGVDGVASNEHGGLGEELRQALLMARLRGSGSGLDAGSGSGSGARDTTTVRPDPSTLTARHALWLGTRGGAQCLGRDDIGSIEVGTRADLAVWGLDGLDHAGIADPVAALVLGRLPRLRLLLVEGEPVVTDGALATADEDVITADLAAAARTMREKARA